MARGGKEYTLTFLLKAAADSSYQAAFAKAKQELNDYQKQIQANNALLKDISAYERQEKAVQRATEALDEKTTALEKAKTAATAATAAEERLKTALEKAKTAAAAAGGADEKLNNALKKAEAETTAAEEKTNKLSAAQDKAQAAVNTATERLNQQEQKLRTQGEALKEAKVDTNNLTTEQERLAKASQNLKQKQEELADSQNQWIQQLAEMEAVAAEAYSVIQIADKLTDAWLACVDAGSGFEAAMSGVRAVTGLTKDEMAEVTAVAKQLGADTVYTATEIANAMEYMGLAGWNAAEIVEGIPAVVNLTAAAGEDLSRVSDIVTDSMQALGYTTEDTTHFCDVLANTVTNANTTVDLMGDTLKYVSSTAGVLGYSIEDVSTAIAAMANNGIKGSQNGTALRSILANLAAPTDKAAAAMERLGVSLVDSNGDTASLDSVITQLRSSFSELTAVEQTKYANDIAGKWAMAGLLAIVNTSQEEYDALAETIRDCDGAAEEMAAVRMDNMAGSVEILSGAWDALKTSIGETYLDGLSAGAEELAVLVDEAAEFASENQQVVIGATAAAGAFGLMAVGITGITTATKLLHTVFAGSALANPALWGAAAAVSAVVGIGAAVATFVSDMETASESIAGISDNLKTLAENEDLLQQYQELQAEIQGAGLSSEELTESQEEQERVVTELKAAYPELLGDIEAGTKAWELQTDAILKNIEAERMQAALDTLGNAGKAGEEYKKAADAYNTAMLGSVEAQTQMAKVGTGSIEKVMQLRDELADAENTMLFESSNVEAAETFNEKLKEINKEVNLLSGTNVSIVNTESAEQWIRDYNNGDHATDFEVSTKFSGNYAESLQGAADAQQKMEEIAENARYLIENGYATVDDFGLSLTSLGYTTEDIWERIHSEAITYAEAVEIYGDGMQDLIYDTETWSFAENDAAEATEKATESTRNSYKEYAKTVKALQAVGSETLTAEQAAVAYGIEVDELNELLDAQEAYESNVAGAVESVKAGYMDAETAADTFGVTLEAMNAYEAEQELELLNETLDELEEAYQSAYESALSSIQGQGSLLEGLSLDADRTKLTLTKGLDSLKEMESYWSTYNSNMELLQGYGLSTDFLTRYCDTSEDGVAATQDLANRLSSLNETERTQWVDDYNEAMDGLMEQQDLAATKTADMQTQYTTMAETIKGRMQELQTETEQNISAMVTSMNKSGQAYSNGYATANSYVIGIRSQISAARAAAQALTAAGTPGSSSGKYTGGKAAGGFTNGPELAGEDPRYPVEAVISFNPAYHDENVEYVKRAAAMLGVDMGTNEDAVDWSGYSFGGLTDYGATLLNSWSGRVAGATVTAAPVYIGSGGGTVAVSYAPNVQISRDTTRSEILGMLQQYDEQLADRIEATVKDMNWQERRTSLA